MKIEPLPLSEISSEARLLAESLHHEARTERIFTICELALREARLQGFKDACHYRGYTLEKENERQDSNSPSPSNP
jgi:hypothetical protein